MESMSIIRMVFCVLVLLFCGAMVYGQQRADTSIYGRWKCVKHDYRGYQKFSLKQAEKIKVSVLTLGRNTFYYGNVKFVASCRFSSWKRSKYDISIYSPLELVYSEEQLKDVILLEPIDGGGKFSCFNDCSIFYLKQDTLINICGGYTYYLKKIRETKKSK